MSCKCVAQKWLKYGQVSITIRAETNILKNLHILFISNLKKNHSQGTKLIKCKVEMWVTCSKPKLDFNNINTTHNDTHEFQLQIQPNFLGVILLGTHYKIAQVNIGYLMLTLLSWVSKYMEEIVVIVYFLLLPCSPTSSEEVLNS